ncbi:MAG: undecaprenyldiphospho-muramoylpentapeptide beta-N-acetylglucosaminyltransferase [Deltaproteobacteria bacterium]|nr:undecaprenyldiphospho-muramoylpentapeptide beta-N-acetylglucosaminyltransferase [Deltaproteobacteria bacterium]
MRLLLAGGGTGGHLFPAVALAQLLLQQDSEAKVLFVGTERGLEQRALPKLGLPLATVDMVGVVGRGWRGKLQLLPKLLKSFVQAKKIISKFKPEIVIGVGGYASVPVLLAAKYMGIPYVIHEQNAIPGLSNRLLGRWARLICLSFPGSVSGFDSSKTVVTGNPLRSGFEDVPKTLAQPGRLLIFGGSRGARAINQAVMQMLPLLNKRSLKPFIHHQTGDEDFRQVQQAYRDAGYDQAKVVPFIDDMPNAYSEASLVICRAGATTLAELTVCGRPAILIPFPFAAADHQTANARMLEEAGAAFTLAQDQLTAETLMAAIEKFFGDLAQLQLMADRGRKIGLCGAAERLLDECRSLLGIPVAEVG